MFKGSNWHICMASLQREQEEDDSEGSGIEEQEIEANEEECGEKGKEEAELLLDDLADRVCLPGGEWTVHSSRKDQEVQRYRT